MCSEYIVDVHQTKVSNINRNILSTNQYCTIKDYVDSKGVQQWGAEMLRVGPTNFFILPHEKIVGGVKNIDVLLEDEALLLYAEKSFKDSEGVSRYSGENWLFKGPGAYQPNIYVKIKDKRKAMPLGAGEGIYIKDVTSGKIRAHIGSTYMLQAHEELWDKPLTPEMEELNAMSKLGIAYVPPKIVGDKLVYVGPDIKDFKRVKHEVITYPLGENMATQLYDFKTKKSKVIFGPKLIMLEPEQTISVQSLSGGRPKIENAIKGFSMRLGPDFMTDQVIVETADHAVLEVVLAYNWHFEYDTTNPDSEENKKLFSVKDFVGNSCKSISSRIRGAISAKSYDEFHNCSAKIIRDSVFGINKETGLTREKLVFKNNNLIITSCDVKSIRPVELDIEQKLKQNTFLSIKIKAEATELAFTSHQEMLEQQKMGDLMIQNIEDNTNAEKQRLLLFEAEAHKNSIQSLGVSVARATAENEKARIEGECSVKLAEIDAETMTINQNQENKIKSRKQELVLNFEKSQTEIEYNEKKELTEIEVSKIERLMKAIGSKNLAEILNAEPKMQQKMLQSLGLKGYLMTDGRNPINLFDTAEGLVQQQMTGAAKK